MNMTKILNLELKIEYRKIRQISSFKYLGAMLSEKSNNEEEIKVRISMNRNASAKLRTYLISGEVPLSGSNYLGQRS